MSIADRLRGGDLRSIGAANAVVSEVLESPQELSALVEALPHEDPVVRARAADALEKISRLNPDWFSAHRKALLSAMNSKQQEVRWHVAQMAPRIDWLADQRRTVVDWLFAGLGDNSRIVHVSALTALAEMAVDSPALRAKVGPLLMQASESPIASLRARARLLLHQFPEIQPA